MQPLLVSNGQLSTGAATFDRPVSCRMMPRFQEPEKKGNFELLEGSTENDILMKEIFLLNVQFLKHIMWPIG
jgi:hypothetical protein